jgi:hypothetical protein
MIEITEEIRRVMQAKDFFNVYVRGLLNGLKHNIEFDEEYTMHVLNLHNAILALDDKIHEAKE